MHNKIGWWMWICDEVNLIVVIVKVCIEFKIVWFNYPFILKLIYDGDLGGMMMILEVVM